MYRSVGWLVGRSVGLSCLSWRTPAHSVVSGCLWGFFGSSRVDKQVLHVVHPEGSCILCRLLPEGRYDATLDDALGKDPELISQVHFTLL